MFHLMDLCDGVGDGHEEGIYIKNSGRVWGKLQPRNPERLISSQREQNGGHRGTRKGILTQERPAADSQNCWSLACSGGSVGRSPDELKSFIPWS